MKLVESIAARVWLLLLATSPVGCEHTPWGGRERAGVSARGAALVTLNEEEFDQRVLKSRRPVVVDFFSPTCTICKGVEPVVASVADEYRGRIDVFKVDVFQQGALAERFRVELPPVFLVFQGGKVVAQLGGPISRDDLVATIEPLMKG
jgi:thioredoxin 1